MSGRVVREFTAFRVGEIVLLRYGTEGRPAGALVRVVRAINTDVEMAYIVQPMAEKHDAHGSAQLLPDGPAHARGPRACPLPAWLPHRAHDARRRRHAGRPRSHRAPST